MISFQTGSSDVRIAELMAALSLATDLGMGQPLEFALSSCVLAVRLGEQIGFDERGLRDVYYYALLRFIGCNAETYALSAIFGDEIALRTDFARVDPTPAPEMLGLAIRYIRQANQGASPLRVAQAIAQGLLAVPEVTRDGYAGHCEVARRLAERLGFGQGLILALGQLYERWDGRGLPGGLKGEDISPAVRVVTLAQDAITFHRLGEVDAGYRADL